MYNWGPTAGTPNQSILHRSYAQYYLPLLSKIPHILWFKQSGADLLPQSWLHVTIAGIEWGLLKKYQRGKDKYKLLRGRNFNMNHRRPLNVVISLQDNNILHIVNPRQKSQSISTCNILLIAWVSRYCLFGDICKNHTSLWQRSTEVSNSHLIKDYRCQMNKPSDSKSTVGDQANSHR